MQIDVTIKGTARMLLHKYPTKTASTKKITSSATDYSDEWIKTTYLNDDGEVVMPWTNLMACLFEGSKGKKKGKIAITRVIYTSLAIVGLEPLVLVDKEPVTIERIKKEGWLLTTGVVVQRSRVDRTRTAIPEGYEISFQIKTKPNNVLSIEDIEEILTNAGVVAGLGDWRPSSPKKPGPYGTFDVIAFKEVK